GRGLHRLGEAESARRRRSDRQQKVVGDVGWAKRSVPTAAHSVGFAALSPPYRAIASVSLLRADVGGPDHVAPLLGFGNEEFAELGRRHDERLGAELGITLLHFRRGLRVVQRFIDL